MRYFAYKQDGEFAGFYSDDVHSAIPTNTVKISDDLWEELIKSCYKLKITDVPSYVILGLQHRYTHFEEVKPKIVSTDKSELQILKETVDTLVLSML